MPRALTDRRSRWTWHPQLPPRTVRLRLTLLYGGLFLVCGAGLLAITYVLVLHATPGQLTYTYRKPDGAGVTICGVAMRNDRPATGLLTHGPGSGTSEQQAAVRTCLALTWFSDAGSKACLTTRH